MSDLNPQSQTPTSAHTAIAFIGGGNMASAIIGGLIRQGWPASLIQVVEPWDEQRIRLAQQFGLLPLAEAGPALQDCSLVVWAVKPQSFKEATAACQPWTHQALHLSVAAGIRSDSLAAWLGTERVVRAMPNTPALVGQGMTGLYARPAVTSAEREQVQGVLAPTGQLLWLDQEQQLDTVTALSGSGPAYVFYFLEAMTQAGADMGLTVAQAHQLAVATFVGASALAQASDEPPAVLRQRVTSKGGTTYAALTHMDTMQVKEHFMQAMQAAAARAQTLGDEFGR
jgi:pyrroline-5-carboxylate reductase